MSFLFSTSYPPDVISVEKMCLVSILKALVPHTAEVESASAVSHSVSQLSLYCGAFMSNGSSCKYCLCQHASCNWNLNIQHSQQLSDMVL